MNDKQERLICDCCENTAFYTANESKVCGKHLSYVVRMHSGFQNDIKVRWYEAEKLFGN